PVFARWDDTFEVAVFERMVLHVHREMALPFAERDPLRHRPARERAVSLEAEVIVEPPRRVALDDKAQVGGRRCRGPERLGCPVTTALAAVLVEAHLWIVARSATSSLPTRCRKDVFPAQSTLLRRG